MIACTRCGKDNQDHYKFCLGCGAELPRDAAKQAKAARPATPPSGFAKEEGGTPAKLEESPKKKGGVPAFGGAPAKSAPQPAAAAAAAAPVAKGGADTVTCEKCAKVNPNSFKFCGACGHNLLEQAGSQSTAASPPPPAPAAAASSVPAQQAARGSLVVIRPDGTEGDTVPLSSGKTAVGRTVGGIFAHDAYLSPNHASFTFEGNSLFVTDENSLNGVYWRVEPEISTTLEDGSIFRIGQEIIRFTTMSGARSAHGVDVMGSPNPGYLGRISLVTGRESTANAYCVPAEGLHLGRERGDIIFPEDGYVSGLHCRIHKEGNKIVITDVGSSNGTFIRVRSKMKVPAGTLVLMGQQLFRVEY